MTCAILTPRKIDNGNAIKYKSEYYQPYVTIDEKIYELRKLESHKKYSEEFNSINEEEKVCPTNNTSIEISII